jgi:hypothetical protein
MPIGDVFQFTAVNLQNAEPCASVFYQKTIEDAGTTDPELDAATALRDVVLDVISEVQSNQVDYECILSRRILPTTTPARAILITLAGKLGGQELPANVAFSFRHYSEDGSKRKRGRWLINGMLEAFVVDGRITEDYVGEFNNIEQTVINPYLNSGRTYQLQHYSKRNDEFYDIDSMIVNPVPVKVRNRTPGLCSIS